MESAIDLFIGADQPVFEALARPPTEFPLPRGSLRQGGRR